MTAPDLPAGPALEDLEREARLVAYDSKGRYGFQRRVLEIDPDRMLAQVVDPCTHITCREWVGDPDWRVPAHRNAAYIALEDRLRKYLHDLRVTRARHRRTGQIPIRLVGGPADGQLHTATAGPNGAPPLTWVVRDPSVNYDRVVSQTACHLAYQMGALPDPDMVWPYRYTGHPGAVHQPEQRSTR
jgi:hypothetical protein